MPYCSGDVICTTGSRNNSNIPSFGANFWRSSNWFIRWYDCNTHSLLHIGNIFYYALKSSKRTGKKHLLFYSSVSCSISLFLLGLYFSMKENNYTSYQSFFWLAVVSVFFTFLATLLVWDQYLWLLLGNFSIVMLNPMKCQLFVSKLFLTHLASSFPLLLNYIGNSSCMRIFHTCAVGAIFFILHARNERKVFP